MKKILYATTALTAAGLIAGMAGVASAQTTQVPSQTDSRSERKSEAAQTAPAAAPAATDGFVSQAAKRIELKLSGYHQQWVMYNNQSYRTKSTATSSSQHQSTNDVDQKHNSEVCIIGQTTLDNGLTIGVNVQIEANTSSDQIDESYLFLQSPSMGRIELGDTNNAGYKLHVTAPDGGISLDSGDLCNIRAFETGGAVQSGGTYGGVGGSLFDTPLCTTNLRLNDNDSGKISYFTPRYAGFQAGVSYIPDFESGGGDNNSALTKNATGDNVNANGTGRSSGQYQGVGAGLNYTEKFGDFGVQASLGYLYAQSGSGLGGAVSNTNLIAYNGGAQFSIAGFSFGGGYLYVPQGQRGATTKFNGQNWTAGAAYEFGPYKVGLDYMTGTNNATSTGGEQRLDQAIVSGTYTMGPGIRLVGGVFYYDWDDENQFSQNNGVGVTTAIKLGF